MKVLVACEFSGTVRDAFTAAGHDAWSCDLRESETPGRHYTGDIRDLLVPGRWDLMIAHPPCTFLTVSGARWLYDPRPKFANRWEQLAEGAAFFRMFLESDAAPRIAVENPQMMNVHAKIRQPDQYVQPYEYGHGETKKTGLWLKNLPLLTATDAVAGRETRVWSMGPSPERERERSRFFPGIAAAMADQWGSLPVLTGVSAGV